MNVDISGHDIVDSSHIYLLNTIASNVFTIKQCDTWDFNQISNSFAVI